MILLMAHMSHGKASALVKIILFVSTSSYMVAPPLLPAINKHVSVDAHTTIEGGRQDSH